MPERKLRFAGEVTERATSGIEREISVKKDLIG